jgi:hypothetical protein
MRGNVFLIQVPGGGPGRQLPEHVAILPAGVSIDAHVPKGMRALRGLENGVGKILNLKNAPISEKIGAFVEIS